jgi:hypothetical protein
VSSLRCDPRRLNKRDAALVGPTADMLLKLRSPRTGAAARCNGVASRLRSKYAPAFPLRCFREPGHDGACDQYPYLRQFELVAPHLASKIKRDATMTTGAAWGSTDAGPNRILRWVMLLSDDELIKFGINMERLSPTIRAKLRDKAATYEDCMSVARRLTWSAYGVPGTPEPEDSIKRMLETEFGTIERGSTVCMICRETFSFGDFALARRGRALIETAHSEARRHDAENVGFAHRECNIAQGDKSLSAFYAWIQRILDNVRAGRGHA